jgi:acyl carrier protein
MTPQTPLTKWSQEAILQRLKQVAREELNMSPEKIAAIDPDAPLVETLQLDSLAQVVLMSNIEQDFGCVFDPDELQQIRTLRDLLAMISSRVSAGAGA